MEFNIHNPKYLVWNGSDYSLSLRNIVSNNPMHSYSVTIEDDMIVVGERDVSKYVVTFKFTQLPLHELPWDELVEVEEDLTVLIEDRFSLTRYFDDQDDALSFVSNRLTEMTGVDLTQSTHLQSPYSNFFQVIGNYQNHHRIFITYEMKDTVHDYIIADSEFESFIRVPMLSIQGDISKYYFDNREKLNKVNV